VSYILDALRRADAERERGSVPSLHAQPAPPAESREAEVRRLRPSLWLVGGLSLALLASLAWQFVGRDAAAPGPAPMVPSSTPARAEPLDPVPAAPAAEAARRSAGAALPPVPAVPATSPSAHAPVEKTAAARAPAATPGPSRPPAPAASAAVPVAAAAEARIPTQAELPEDIRRQLPALSIGGSIYSDHAASRFLIVNGQIFHEKDRLMPGLVLEQIKLKSAVLNYKGQRYSIAY
jgi:general secretion pathway protein B